MPFPDQGNFIVIPTDGPCQLKSHSFNREKDGRVIGSEYHPKAITSGNKQDPTSAQS